MGPILMVSTNGIDLSASPAASILFTEIEQEGVLSLCLQGVTIVFAPLGTNLGSAIREDSFTLMANRVNTDTGRTSPGDVDDFDAVRQLSLPMPHCSLWV